MNLWVFLSITVSMNIKTEMLCSKTFISLNRYERPEKTTKQFKLVKVV